MNQPNQINSARQPSPDHERLVEAWIAGDQAAFDKFFEQTYQSHFLKRAAHLMRHGRQVGRYLEPDDLVQETYLKLKASPPNTFMGMPAFWSWVRTAMKKVFLDMMRNQQAQKRGGRHIQWIDMDWLEACLNGQGGRQS